MDFKLVNTGNETQETECKYFEGLLIKSGESQIVDEKHKTSHVRASDQNKVSILVSIENGQIEDEYE